MEITIVLERTDNNWGAYTPDEIGSVIVTGPTREETIARFREALRFHLEGMREEGLSVPDIT